MADELIESIESTCCFDSVMLNSFVIYNFKKLEINKLIKFIRVVSYSEIPMTKKYIPVPDDKRRELIRLIHEEGQTITRAAACVGVRYPVAKVINNIFKLEGRTDKKITRDRRCVSNEL